MESENQYVRLQHIVRRDEQALWVAGWLLEVMSVADMYGSWYRGEKGAETPKSYLSAITKPGEDGACGIRHRIGSLAREMAQFDPLDCESFGRFTDIGYAALDMLAKLAELKSVADTRASFDEFIDYVRRVGARKVEDGRFSARLQQMAEAYADGWGRISDDFAKIERELLGMGPSDPELAQIAEAVESIDRAVKDQRRERRGQPAGMVTRIWVCRQVAFYKENPQLLKVDVSRRRVYMRDVWAMVKGEGRDKHGIKDFNHFARIYDTAQRDIRRKRGECERVDAGSC